MLDKRKSHPSIYRQCSRADDNHAEKHSLFEVPIIEKANYLGMASDELASFIVVQ